MIFWQFSYLLMKLAAMAADCGRLLLLLLVTLLSTALTLVEWNNINNHFTALGLGLPGWAGTRRNIHPPTIWSSSNLYQLIPSTMIHSILPVQITCLAIFLHNLPPCPLWCISWSGALHLIFHTFLHSISVFFSQHMPIPSQPVLLVE